VVPVAPVAFVVPVTLVPEAEPVVLGVAVAPGADDRLAYSCADWKGVQLDDAGTRGVYGIVAMAPRDSGGWVYVTTWPLLV
jgi:hypothetical protein